MKKPVDRGSNPDSLQETLTYLLVRLGRRLDLLEMRIAHRHGIGLNDLKVLFLLNQCGPMSMSDAVRETSLDLGQVSRSIRVLEDRNLLGITISDLDARKKLLALTEQGKSLLTTALPERERLERQLRSALDQDGIVRLSRELEAMLDNLIDFDQSPDQDD